MLTAFEQFPINRLPPFLLGGIAREVLDCRNQGRDIYDFSQLSPNSPPSGSCVEAMVQASLQPHNHRYSASQGIQRLRAAICKWYASRFRVEVDLDKELVVTLGTKQGLSHLLLATLNAGDSVILPSPFYPIHAATIALVGAHALHLPLPSLAECQGVLTESAESFFDQLVKLYESSWPRPKMMLLSFPHNPSGMVATLGFFERLVALAKELKIILVHDFAYADLAYDGFKTPSILEVAGAKDVAVELYSTSKALNLPGWRIGSLAGNPELVECLKRIKSYLDNGGFQPLQIGAAKAFDNYGAIIAENVERYLPRRNALVDGLASLGFKVVKPKASLFVWAGLCESLESAGSIRAAQRLLQEAEVASCPGVGFDLHADKFLRFSLLEPEPRIRAAISKMELILK